MYSILTIAYFSSVTRGVNLFSPRSADVSPASRPLPRFECFVLTILSCLCPARRHHFYVAAVHGSIRGVRLHVALSDRHLPTCGGEILLRLFAGDSRRHANGSVRTFPDAGLRDRCHHREDRE